MSLDLDKLENKLDEALSNETTESLNKFLNDKRMKNNKQQTALEIFWNQLPEILPFTVDTATAVKLDEAYQQAKELEKQQHATTWDKAMDNLDSRGGNMVRAWVDFDDYFNETYGGGNK